MKLLFSKAFNLTVTLPILLNIGIYRLSERLNLSLIKDGFGWDQWLYGAVLFLLFTIFSYDKKSKNGLKFSLGMFSMMTLVIIWATITEYFALHRTVGFICLLVIMLTSFPLSTYLETER